MVNKAEIKAMAKNILRHNRGIKKRQIMHPPREWTLGLVFCLLIFISFSIWSTQTYLKYKEISVDTTQVSSEEVVVYRGAMVSDALNLFRQKEQKFNQLLNISAAIELEEVEELPNEADTATSTSEVEGVDFTAQETSPTTIDLNELEEVGVEIEQEGTASSTEEI